MRDVLFTDGAKYVADQAGPLDEIALAQRGDKRIAGEAVHLARRSPAVRRAQRGPDRNDQAAKPIVGALCRRALQRATPVGVEAQASIHRSPTVPTSPTGPQPPRTKPEQPRTARDQEGGRERVGAASKQGRFTPYAPSVLTLGNAARLISLFRNRFPQETPFYKRQPKS